MKRILRILLLVFRMNGVDPRSQGFISKILKLISLAASTTVFLLYVLEMTLNWNGIKTLGKTFMFPSICMMLLKVLVLQLKNKSLYEIIMKLEDFDIPEHLGKDLEDRLNSIFRRIENYTKIYFVLCMILVFTFMISSLFTSDPSLYFDSYEICDIYTQPCYIYYFFWQNATLFGVALSNVIGFDCLFFYFVSEAYCAFEITKEMLKKIRANKISRKELDLFVKQHDKAMNYVKEMNNLYSTLMLAQCWFSMEALILNLYVLTSEGIPPPVRLLVKFGMLYMFFALQFFIYCLGGNVILNQSKSIADVAFDVDWWSETRPELRRSLLLIIARSQRVEKISVGGIMDLNFECFVKVLSNSLSAYTLLRTMETKGNMLQNNM